jgi:hypothetical protein
VRPRNPTLDRWSGDGKKSPAYRRSRKQEKETAKRLGGRTVIASGAKFRKGDAEVPGIARIECKATGADSFRVTKEMLDKIDNAAIGNDQIAIIEIEFVDQLGKPIDSVCVLRRSALTALLNRLADGSSETAAKRGVRRVKLHDASRSTNKE